MKKILFALTALVFFSQCTPKTGEVVKKTEEVVSPPAEDFRAQVPKPGPAPVIKIGTPDEFKLTNGLKVILVENHKVPRVSIQLSLDLPSIREKEFAGYISLAGDMLSKGTDSRTKGEIDEAVDFMGASLNTSSNGISGASLSKHFPSLLEIMADVLYHPTFPKEEFEKLKTQTLSSLAQAKEDPNSIASNVSQVLRYGKDHPYGEIVTELSLENVTVEKCKEYYDRFFQPQYGYLVVVGDISKTEAQPLLEEHFGKWKSSGPMVEYKKPATPVAPKETTLDFVNKTDAVQSVIALTYPVDLKPGSEDAIKSRVMNTLLGSFFQSRLNQNLRETNGYTYGARSRLSSDRLVGYFTAGASVRNEVTDSSIVEMLFELNRLRDELVSQDELDMVKNVIAGSFARSLENPGTVASFALNTVRYNLPADYYNTYLERLSKVNVADVQEMAKKYITPDRAHILVVGDKEQVADKLSRFSANGKINYYDVYGTKNAE